MKSHFFLASEGMKALVVGIEFVVAVEDLLIDPLTVVVVVSKSAFVKLISIFATICIFNDPNLSDICPLNFTLPYRTR